MNSENIGAIWVPISDLKKFSETGETESSEIKLVFNEGTPLSEDGNLKRFLDFFYELKSH